MNARNPIKTNVKTHVNVCTSIKSKESRFSRKIPDQNRKIVTRKIMHFLKLFKNDLGIIAGKDEAPY